MTSNNTPTAALFVDAVHTANALAAALMWWLLFLAATAVFVVPAVVAGVVWAVDTARRALTGARSAVEPVPVPESPRSRHTPSWAAYSHDEAA